MSRYSGLTLDLNAGDEKISLRFQIAMIVEGRPIVLPQPDALKAQSGGWQATWNRISADIPLLVEVSATRPNAENEILLTSRLVNQGGQPVFVDYFQPLCMDRQLSGTLDVGAGETRMRVFAMAPEANGYTTRVQEFCSCDSPEEFAITDRASGLESFGVTVLQAPASGRALAAGFTDFAHQFSTLSVAHNADGVCRLVAEAECQKAIAPGESMAMSPLWIAAGDDPLALLERYAERVRDQMGIRLSADNMPCGWLSWYGYRTTLSEQEVRANAEVVRKSMFPLGGRVCIMDLGWNEGDRPGDWLGPNERYPSGVDQLCRELAADGFQVGAWSTPILVSEKSHVAQEHPEWLLRNADGQPIVITQWYWEPAEDCYCLDPSLPAVRAHVGNVYRALRGWGITMFKLDFAGAFTAGLGQPSATADRRLPIHYAVPDGNRAEQCRRLYATIREAIGDAHMMVANAPWQGVVGITDSLFLANDVANQTDSESQDERPLRRGWAYFRARTRHTFARWFMHGRAWWGNPDSFVAENDAPDHHSRARLQVVMLGGGQYKCSNRIATWRPDRLAWFLKGLPWYGKAAVPIDLFDAEYPRLLDLPVQTEWDAWHVVGVFNWENCDADVRLDFDRLRPPAKGAQLVWDFWDHRLLGLAHDGVAVPVPPETATLVAVRNCLNRPQILGTDLHFTMGWAEIPSCQWNEATGTLSGVARRCVGAQGNLFLYVPSGWRHPDAVSTLHGGAVLELPLTFDRPELPWSVVFEPCPQSAC